MEIQVRVLGKVLIGNGARLYYTEAKKRVWNILRNGRKPINEFINNNRITTKQWEDYFQKLYDGAIAGEQQTPENIEEENQTENWDMTKTNNKIRDP